MRAHPAGTFRLICRLSGQNGNKHIVIRRQGMSSTTKNPLERSKTPALPERDSESVALGFLAGLVFATVMSILRPRDRYR